MIIADENIDRLIIQAIKETGIEVYSVFELQRGIRDEDIIKLSQKPRRIILTEDKDFGEWVYAHQHKDISVILLRYDFKDTEQMAVILKRLLLDKGDILFGKFTTVTLSKVRIRNI